jgi:lambda family phage portal protein
MNILESIKRLFGGKKPQQRNFSEIIASAGGDWALSNLSIDAEVFQNVFGLRAAMRDLWRSNPYLAKYQEQLAANVFGDGGIMLRSKIKDTEDRVVYSQDEKWALIAHERKVNRLREHAKAMGRKTPGVEYRALHLADALAKRSTETILRGQAYVEVGAPDVYARQRVEALWAEFQKAENCDVRKARDYNTLRQIRLWACARDGGHFIQMIRGNNVNALGFTLRHVNDEWVDHFYNVTFEAGETLPDGSIAPEQRVVRLGIEYKMNSWGIGEVTAYYFIRRLPRDWQTSARYSGSGYAVRDRIPAEHIIHYARVLDTDSTRPAPWGVAMLGKVRQLDQYEIAEVVAARMQACATGWLTSSTDPNGGLGFVAPDPETAARKIDLVPGGLYGLPWGVDAPTFSNVTHPNGNFKNFRQGMGQSVSAALPGGDYNIIFNDLENINFSAGRLGRLDTNEINKMLQVFDINKAERRIFENMLENALLLGVIPLPVKKFFKFKQAHFQGRRWGQVDEGKAIDAAAKRIGANLSNWGLECAEEGLDFEDVITEKAENLMAMEQLGIDPTLPGAVNQVTPVAVETEDVEKEPPKTNGTAHPELDLSQRIAITS